ncbi:dGTPase [Chromobacterium sp.]|uniref:dGTPase n=1 Tax=Chromobacterium sp. TaxID=306190 RepID=UPI0035B0E1F4
MSYEKNVTEEFLNDALKNYRVRTSEVRKSGNLVENAESDRGRILYSAAFRRLQQKAQVFSLEPNAAVRSRLTHSLEVSQVGRYISDKIVEKGNVKDSEIARSLSIFVETACLAHDIGNPPFGHFGEAAIQQWFEKNGEELLKKALPKNPSNKTLLADFIEFDGNPQGLRIISKLQWNNDEFGLNLTSTALLSCIKYLRCAGTGKSSDPLFKKAGFFQTESSLVEKLWHVHNINTSKPTRYPLAAIMEAADDISYCISDLEDSVEKGIVSLHDAANWISERWENDRTKSKLDHAYAEINSTVFKIKKIWGEKSQSNYTFTDFRTATTRFLVDYAAENFIQKITTYTPVDTLLPEDSAATIFLEILKDYCRENVYCNENVELIEYAGYTAITGLLNIFEPLLSCNKDTFECALNQETKDSNNNKIVIEKKLLRLFPEKYIKAYKHSLTGKSNPKFNDNQIEWLSRTHLVIDFLAGMTDDYSIELYRTLSGIKVL